MSSPTTAFDLLTVREVAVLLHCSKAHVCNLAAGKVKDCLPLPAVHMGRRMLIRRESLMHWLEENEAVTVIRPKVRKTA